MYMKHVIITQIKVCAVFSIVTGNHAQYYVHIIACTIVHAIICTVHCTCTFIFNYVHVTMKALKCKLSLNQ